MSISIRFVLSGACHPSYSGRRVQLEVPLVQESGVPTTTADIKRMIRTEWPSELSEMADVINTAEMKILKTGNLLTDDATMQSFLSATEIRDCATGAAASGTRDDDDPRYVLMHLVFQKSRVIAKRDKDGTKNAHEGPSDNGCCRVM